MLAPTVATVDLDAIRHNVRVLQAAANEVADGSRLMAVVKADAYGHGAERVVGALRAEGVRDFAVATVPEAVALRAAGVEDRILVFAAPLPEYLPAYAAHGLDVTVSSPAVADAVTATAGPGRRLRVHVKVDTGMGRIGVEAGEAADVLARLGRAPHVEVAGLWTHFATADETDADGEAFVRTQQARFRALSGGLGPSRPPIHVANSAGLLMHGDVAAGTRFMRAGIALYGIADLPGAAEAEHLRPAMRLTSRITHLKTVDAGTSVSYGRQWRAERPTIIGTVAAGYADGYRRVLTNRAWVGVGGRQAPVAGAVCMDMFMVDLGPPGGLGRGVQVGDEVVLFGSGGPSAITVAAWAETISYEITCGVSARVPRRYV